MLSTFLLTYMLGASTVYALQSGKVPAIILLVFAIFLVGRYADNSFEFIKLQGIKGEK